jgi:hypothetical protein
MSNLTVDQRRDYRAKRKENGDPVEEAYKVVVSVDVTILYPMPSTDRVDITRIDLANRAKRTVLGFIPPDLMRGSVIKQAGGSFNEGHITDEYDPFPQHITGTLPDKEV